MNKLFDIPKMKIVVISAAVIVTLSVITVTVACLKANETKKDDDDTVNAMVSADESETEPPDTPTFRLETRAPKASPHIACVSSCPRT